MGTPGNGHAMGQGQVFGIVQDSTLGNPSVARKLNGAATELLHGTTPASDAVKNDRNRHTQRNTAGLSLACLARMVVIGGLSFWSGPLSSKRNVRAISIILMHLTKLSSQTYREVDFTCGLGSEP